LPKKSVGRPVSKTGAAAAKERAAKRKRYQSLPLSERKAIVQNRDKAAQRKADAKRYASQKTERDAYHKEQARAKSGKKKPATCQAPGCKNKPQFHHQGTDKWLCPTHHAQARGYKK